MLVLGIDHASGVILVHELDDVLTQMVRSARELVTQRAVLPRHEVRTPHLFFAHTDVRREQVDVGIHVTHV